ncbi:MAG: prolipoprotein diacylglyceryl transferase [Ktedonobacteraceae bacterium]
MARKSQIRVRPGVNGDVVQPTMPTHTDAGFTTVLESVLKPILAVTYWFDPAQYTEPSAVTVRFSGHRVDVRGRLKAGDRFVQDEIIEQVVAGSGPISVTARIRAINAGEWAVTAHIVRSTHLAHGAKQQENETLAAEPSHPVARFWRRWAPSVEPSEQVSTCLTPFAHVPGILPGIWGAMVALGMAIALTLQALLITSDHLAVGQWWVISPVAIVVGMLGAKVWYIVMYQHRLNGWCIQGFVTGATLTAAILPGVLHVPVGVFLDATTPGLLFAMAVGRIGCFFAGCCGGPLTASRWGVWSSDQRVGARRIPTQLLESALALCLGLGILVALQVHGSASGAFLVGGLAAYTLVRQGILYLRAERRKTKLGGPVTVALSALVLVAAVVFLIR